MFVSMDVALKSAETDSIAQKAKSGSAKVIKFCLSKWIIACCTDVMDCLYKCIGLGCRDDCYQCSDGNECSACFSPLLLKDGKCVRSCGNGFYDDDDKCSPCSRHCDQCTGAMQCTTCQSSHVLYAGQCITSCPRGLYLSEGTKSCLSCSANCAECRDSTECSSCVDGTFLRSGRCVSSCGEGYYGNLRERICEGKIFVQVFGLSNSFHLYL